MPAADLLLHPVRMRVVQAFLGGRTLTTGELRDELADVPVAFAAMLLGDFDRYLQRAGDPPDLLGDRVGYRRAAVWVTDEEFDAMIAELAAVVQARLAHRPDGARRRRLFSTVNLLGE